MKVVSMKHPVSGGIGRADLRNTAISIVVVMVLVALSAAGLFLESQPYWQLLRLSDGLGALRSMAVVLLLGALALATLRFVLKGRSRGDEVLFLVALACAANFVLQLSGGLRSSWQALYLMLVGLASASFPVPVVASLIGAILFIEGGNWLLHRVGTLEDLFRLAGMVVLSAVAFGYLQRAERRRAERAEGELQRLNLGLQQLEQPSEEEKTSPLSDEGKRLGRVEYARGLERRLEDLLKLTRVATQSLAVCLLQTDPSGDSFVTCLAVDETGHRTSANSVGVDGLLAEAVRQDRPLSVSEDPRPLPDFPWYPHQPELHSLLAIPMGGPGASRWVLALVDPEPRHFDAQRVELARAVAEQMSQWLTSTRHLADLDTVSAELRRLYEASAGLSQALRVAQILDLMVSFCREAARFETCAICLVQEGEETFTVPVAEGYPDKVKGATFPLESSTWTGWILRCREEPLVIGIGRRSVMPILYSGEKATRDATLLGIPLRAKNRVSGALILTRKGDPFSSNERRVLRILCNQAAVAMENARVYERLEQLAATDALTGLFNRRYFEQALVREVARAERRDRSLALLIIDIDNFKLLNDTYGHTMGDLVLRKVAETLSKVLRKGDVLARYGGEEFVVLLPEITYRGAGDFAERVRRQVASAPLHPGGSRRQVTVSVGWALYPQDTQTWQKLVDLADRALYFAKDTGRNRVAGYHLLRAEVES